MALKLGDVFVAIGTKDETDKGFAAVRRKANAFLHDITTGISQGLGQALAQGIGSLINTGIAQIGKSVDAATNLNRELRRTTTIFGENAAEIRAWASTANTNLGLTETAALKAASSFGNLFVQMGITGDEAATMSKQMVEAARDVAAFNGVDVTTVLETMQAAFRQEYDSLQRFIPAISDAAIKQQALAETGKEVEAQLTANEKLLATQTLILNGAALAAGFYAESLDTAAGQENKFTRSIEQGLARIGQVFEPIKRTFFQGLNELLELVAPYGEGILDSFASGLAKGIVALTPILAQLRAAFVYWLEPGSPPRLLPELTAWGKSSMEEYLRGWTLADFDALRAVSGIIESVVRSFAARGDIKETDLVSRIFGTQRTIQNAIREFRQLGQVSEATLGSIADAAGPAGTEVAGLVREYFNLQRATQAVTDAQNELNAITRQYDDALRPVNDKLASIRERQEDIRDQQELEELGKTLKDPRALASERELARLRIEEISLADHAEALENERDTAVDAAQAKITAVEAEAEAQKARFSIFQSALEQQQQTNALVAEEIDLRTRLANEAMAEEEKRLRELEQEAKKHAATLERIADAQLRWRLASTDTAGQIAIMEQELARFAVGSAEHFSILTQLIDLRERLAKETAAGGDPFSLFTPEGGATGDIEAATGGFKELEEALKGIFAAGKGEGGGAKLSPVFQNIIDAIKNIDDFVAEVSPRIQTFYNLILGKDSATPQGGEDPFGDNFWLAGIIPFMDATIQTLEQILNGDWAGLWQRAKDYVADVLGDPTLKERDPGTYGFYTWLSETAIPAIDDIINTDWQLVWDTAAGIVQTAWDTIAGYVQTGIDKVQEAFDRLKKFYEALKEFVLPGSSQQGPGFGEDPLPPSNFSSFPGGSIAPLAPAGAGASSTVSGNTLYFHVEQYIGANDDVGGASAGAQNGVTILAELINGRLNS